MSADNVSWLRDCPQNFTFALEASLLGQMFIFRTISQPRTLSADITAAWRGLFTKYYQGMVRWPKRANTNKKRKRKQKRTHRQTKKENARKKAQRKQKSTKRKQKKHNTNKKTQRKQKYKTQIKKHNANKNAKRKQKTQLKLHQSHVNYVHFNGFVLRFYSFLALAHIKKFSKDLF